MDLHKQKQFHRLLLPGLQPSKEILLGACHFDQLWFRENEQNVSVFTYEITLLLVNTDICLVHHYLLAILLFLYAPTMGFLLPQPWISAVIGSMGWMQQT